MMFSLRPATAADAGILARLHVQGWRNSYVGLVNQAYLDSLDEQARALDWRDRLAIGNIGVLLACGENDTPAGFVSYGRVRMPLPRRCAIGPLYTGEIYSLYILPTFWRNGLGRDLMAGAALKLAGMKHKSLCLWVLDGNKRAISFYQACGGQRCGRKEVEIGGKCLKELCFGWRDTAVFVKRPEMKF